MSGLIADSRARVSARAGAAARRGDGALLLVLVGAAVLFLVGLGQSSLWDQDEAKYTQVAREILQTGDPITLHVNGTAWFVHPPLFMWLQAVTGALFGFSELTARLWSALFGVLGVYATFLLGRTLFNRRTALLGAVVLASTFQYFAQARLAVFDGALVAFMLLAFYAFLRALDGERRFAYWAALWAGLGTMTKGPIALLLPALVAAAYLAARRSSVRPAGRVWLGALGLYAAVAAPWYIVEWIRHGWPFIRTVIGYYTVNRFLGVVEGQSGRWWYYLPVFGLGAFPWTAFFVAMLPIHVARRREAGSLLVLLWCGITVVFYSVAGTKLPNYVLPVYPFAALGIAAVWDQGFDRVHAGVRTLAAAFAFTVAGLVLFAAEIGTFARAAYPTEFAALQRHLVILASVLMAWLALGTVLFLIRRLRASFAVVAGTIVLLGAAFVLRTMPLVEAQRPTKAVALAVRDALREEDAPLAGFRISDHQTLLYYTDHRVYWVDDLLVALTLACQGRVVLVTTEPLWRLWQDVTAPRTRPDVTVLIRRGGLVAAAVRGRGPCPVPAVGR